jgi:hypothetical protein
VCPQYSVTDSNSNTSTALVLVQVEERAAREYSLALATGSQGNATQLYDLLFSLGPADVVAVATAFLPAIVPNLATSLLRSASIANASLDVPVISTLSAGGLVAVWPLQVQLYVEVSP